MTAEQFSKAVESSFSQAIQLVHLPEPWDDVCFHNHNRVEDERKYLKRILCKLTIKSNQLGFQWLACCSAARFPVQTSSEEIWKLLLLQSALAFSLPFVILCEIK